MKTSKKKGSEEKETEIFISESGFDASYSKMTKLLRNKPTLDKVELFMKENPGVIVYVPKEKVKEGQKKLKLLNKDSLGKKTTRKSRAADLKQNGVK